MCEFDEYIAIGETEQKKSIVRKTTFGLKDMNWIYVSAYLLDTARQHIEGIIYR